MLAQFQVDLLQHVRHHSVGRHAHVAHPEAGVAKVEAAVLSDFSEYILIRLDPVTILREVDEAPDACRDKSLEALSRAVARRRTGILAGEKTALSQPVGTGNRGRDRQTLPPSMTWVNRCPERITSGEAPIMCNRLDARGAASTAISAATMTPSRIDWAAASQIASSQKMVGNLSIRHAQVRPDSLQPIGVIVSLDGDGQPGTPELMVSPRKRKAR